MQANDHCRRFARANSAAVRSEAGEGGAVAALRRGILDRWRLSRHEGRAAGKAAEGVGGPQPAMVDG